MKRFRGLAGATGLLMAVAVWAQDADMAQQRADLHVDAGAVVGEEGVRVALADDVDQAGVHRGGVGLDAGLSGRG